MEFEVEGISAVIALVLIAVVPIRVGANWVGANKTDLLSCGIAAIVGVIAGAVASSLFGSAMGGPLAGFLGFIVAIRFILGTSLGGAFMLSIIAAGVSFLAMAFLSEFF